MSQNPVNRKFYNYRKSQNRTMNIFKALINSVKTFGRNTGTEKRRDRFTAKHIQLEELAEELNLVLEGKTDFNLLESLQMNTTVSFLSGMTRILTWSLEHLKRFSFLIYNY